MSDRNKQALETAREKLLVQIDSEEDSATIAALCDALVRVTAQLGLAGG